MRFVSRSANYRLIARNDEEYQVFDQISGQLVPKSVRRPLLICEFKHGMARPDEVYAAKLHWNGTPSSRTDPDRVDAMGHPVPDAYGAMPYQRAIPIRDGVGRITGVSEPHRPDYNFSLFDSEWIQDEDDRKVAEQALLNNPDNNIWYVRVEKARIPAPWPGYDKMRGTKARPIEQAILGMIDDGGFDIGFVLEYEKANKNRDAVVQALEVKLGEQAAAAAEREAMSVTVG